MTLPSHSLALWEPSTVPIDPPALNLSLITVMGPAANTAGTVPGAMGNDAIANLFFTGGAAAGAVPLEYIGGGGTGMGIVGGVPVTIVGAVWTNLGVTSPTDVRTVMIATTAAGIPMTVTASAFDNRQHGNGRGTVQLVAPAFAKIFGGVLGTLPVIGVLTIDVPTPEPGTLLLVGGGLVGLAGLGRRQRP